MAEPPSPAWDRLHNTPADLPCVVAGCNTPWPAMFARRGAGQGARFAHPGSPREIPQPGPGRRVRLASPQCPRLNADQALVPSVSQSQDVPKPVSRWPRSPAAPRSPSPGDKTPVVACFYLASPLIYAPLPGAKKYGHAADSAPLLSWAVARLAWANWDARCLKSSFQS